MKQYFIEDENNSTEISQTEFDEIISESDYKTNGYTVYNAEAKLLIIEDDETKDTWDDDQICLAAYKKDGMWFEVPDLFKDTIINFKD